MMMMMMTTSESGGVRDKLVKIVCGFVEALSEDVVESLMMKYKTVGVELTEDAQDKFVQGIEAVLLSAKSKNEHGRNVELSKLYHAKFVRNVTLDDKTGAVCLKPGERRVKLWELQNTGLSPWSSHCCMVQVGSKKCVSNKGKRQALFCPEIAPDDSAVVASVIRVPKKCGEYHTFWMMVDEEGRNMLDEVIEWVFTVIKKRKRSGSVEKRTVPSFHDLPFRKE